MPHVNTWLDKLRKVVGLPIVHAPLATDPATYQILMHSCDLHGKFTIVQVDIQQLYVHCAKESTRLPVPLYFKKIKNRADFAMLMRAD